MNTDDQLCSKQNEDFVAANRIKTLLLKMLFEERSLRLKEVGKLVSQNEVSRLLSLFNTIIDNQGLAFKVTKQGDTIHKQSERIRELEDELRIYRGGGMPKSKSRRVARPVSQEIGGSTLINKTVEKLLDGLVYHPRPIEESDSNSYAIDQASRPDFEHLIIHPLRENEVVVEDAMTRLGAS